MENAETNLKNLKARKRQRERERRRCERMEVVADSDGFLRGREGERRGGKKQRKQAQESGNRKIGRGVGRERWREEEMPKDEVVTLV